MADLENTIKRIEDWIDAPFATNAEIDPQIVHDALELLKAQPQIVMCKDCKYWDYLIADRGRCDEMSVTHVGEFYTDSDWYCADGERKES